MKIERMLLVAVLFAVASLNSPALGQSLTLNVDPLTGITDLTNMSSASVEIDGYSIFSPGGHLNGVWSSLQDQAVSGWDEADNSNDFRATELNPVGSLVLGPGESVSLGTPYDPQMTPTALGELVEDLSFLYTQPSGETNSTPVNYVGGINNVVLSIDPASGAGSIYNGSAQFGVAIDGYTITSASGKLAPDSWNSLQDQSLSGWDEADNSDSFRLTELNPTGSTQLDGGGVTLDIGNAFNVVDGVSVDDLHFEFLVAGGESATGSISLGMASVGETCMVPAGGIAGDFDGNGTVEFADFLTQSGNFGKAVSTYQEGDTDCSGEVDFADFLTLSANFGKSVGGAASVPEPAALSLLLFGFAGLLLRRQRN